MGAASRGGAARSPLGVLVCAFVGAMFGTVLVHIHLSTHQGLAAYGGTMQSLTAVDTAATGAMKQAPAEPVDHCPAWSVTARAQKQIQRDYCIRRFNGEAPRDDLLKTRLVTPGQRFLDFFVYKSDDIVSGAIQSNGHWELHLSTALVQALERVAETKGLPRDRVHLLDIGGNVGAHTTYAQAAGFSVVAFEPLPQNEDIIRSNLCVADPRQKRVTLFTKGLGSTTTLCQQYSAPNYNRGNGVVNCDGEVPQHPDGQLTFRGQMEVVPLDEVLLPCGGGQELPAGMVFGAMKMDVEGFEPHVLKGAEGFLTKARIPFIVFEIGRMKPEERQYVLRFFYNLGYKASTQGFFAGLGQPDDLPGVEDVHLVLVGEVGEGVIAGEGGDEGGGRRARRGKGAAQAESSSMMER